MAKIKSYDLICLGGGSAGFNAARFAAGLGRKVAIIDGAKELGGLCILRGCMPSKTLLYTAEMLHHAQHADRFGLRVKGATADMKAVHARKKKIIEEKIEAATLTTLQSYPVVSQTASLTFFLSSRPLK